MGGSDFARACRIIKVYRGRRNLMSPALIGFGVLDAMIAAQAAYAARDLKKKASKRKR